MTVLGEVEGAMAGAMDMAPEHWFPVGPSAALRRGGILGVVVREIPLAIYHSDLGFFATAGLCTHARAHLADGRLCGVIVQCPLHLGAFDIRTGKGLCSPIDADLAIYAVTIVKGTIYVRIPGEILASGASK
jgi:nitrite reductase/ring-hydroxylating ferredoxin subunit